MLEAKYPESEVSSGALPAATEIRRANCTTIQILQRLDLMICQSECIVPADLSVVSRAETLFSLLTQANNDPVISKKKVSSSGIGAVISCVVLPGEAGAVNGTTGR